MTTSKAKKTVKSNVMFKKAPKGYDPAKPDDGKSSVQVRIDRELLAKAREVAKGRRISLDALAEEVLKFSCDPFPIADTDASILLNPPGSGRTIEQMNHPFPDLNPGTLLDAEAFCEKRGWTLSFLVNRALIDILESMR